jgi:hypothetical protein
MAKYQEANYETLRNVPKKTQTAEPCPRESDFRFSYHVEDRAGGSCEKSSHEEGRVSYEFYHFATGWGVLPNGEKFERNMNCVNKYTLGGEIDVGNGNKTSSITGSASQAASAQTNHCGEGRGLCSIPASAPARSVMKNSCDVAASQVFAGDGAIVAGGTLGMAAQEMNICSVGNFNCGSVEGSFSLVGEAGASFGSKKSTCQLGGKGVTLLAQGGPLSAESSGQMSLYTTGADIVISGGGGRVLINCSSAPPKTVDDTRRETFVPGAKAVPSSKVIGA